MITKQADELQLSFSELEAVSNIIILENRRISVLARFLSPDFVTLSHCLHKRNATNSGRFMRNRREGCGQQKLPEALLPKLA